MQRHFSTLVLAAALSLAATGQAQNRYLWSPTGADKSIGGSNNTIPWWGKSATYQQIHSKEDLGALNNGAPVVMKGMAMRPWGNANRAYAGRSWDLKLFLNHTKAVGTAASSVFATNLGTGAKQVFGTTTTFTTFSWKSTTSISGVNPPAWTIPFTSSFLYIPNLGNLCWEWRHKNATNISTIPMDAASAGAQRGTAGAPVGTGCSGSSTAMTTPSSAGVYSLKLDLMGAAANANALIAIGLTQQNVDLGWCGNVRVVPTILLPTKTAGNGSITLSVPHTAMQGLAQTDILFQFAWDDKSAKGGVGLSEMRPFKSPAMPGAHAMARIWKSGFGNQNNGDELATSGSVGNRYGVVIGWLQ